MQLWTGTHWQPLIGVSSESHTHDPAIDLLKMPTILWDQRLLPDTHCPYPFFYWSGCRQPEVGRPRPLCSGLILTDWEQVTSVNSQLGDLVRTTWVTLSRDDGRRMEVRGVHCQALTCTCSCTSCSDHCMTLLLLSGLEEAEMTGNSWTLLIAQSLRLSQVVCLWVTWTEFCAHKKISRRSDPPLQVQLLCYGSAGCGASVKAARDQNSDQTLTLIVKTRPTTGFGKLLSDNQNTPFLAIDHMDMLPPNHCAHLLHGRLLTEPRTVVKTAVLLTEVLRTAVLVPAVLPAAVSLTAVLATAVSLTAFVTGTSV